MDIQPHERRILAFLAGMAAVMFAMALGIPALLGDDANAATVAWPPGTATETEHAGAGCPETTAPPGSVRVGTDDAVCYTTDGSTWLQCVTEASVGLAVPVEHGAAGCPTTGTYGAGAVAESTADATVCFTAAGGTPGTFLECIDQAAVGLAVPVEHGGAGCPSSGSYAEGTVALSTADATLCYCTASGSPGTWWTIVETVETGPTAVANWAALPGAPADGDQAFVSSSSLTVTWVDAYSLWLPEPWASDVQGRVANGSAVDLYISVSGGDDELTDLTSRGWVAEGTPTFSTDRFVFGETRVESAPASWPTVALYAIRADCTQASGTQAISGFAPAVYDGTKTAIASRSWGATAATGAENQTGIASATTPGTTFYGVAQGGFATRVTADLTWSWLIVDAGGSVTLIHQDSPHRSVVPYSGLGTVLATTDEIWVGTGLTVGEVPEIAVSEFHAFDLDAP